MAACERCWAEYRWRQVYDPSVSYSQVLAERDAAGGCTPVEQCGDQHVRCIPTDRGDVQCRCGARVESVQPDGAEDDPDAV